MEFAPEVTPEVTPDLNPEPTPQRSADWQQRAEAAEQELEQARTRLAELDGELTASREAITALERRQRIDALLSESDAVDLEAARLLTEAAVAQMDDPDVKLAVEDLRKHKPYLFRRTATATPATGAMAPHVDDDPPAQQAAQRAAATGHRTDLLKYLRLRRNC